MLGVSNFSLKLQLEFGAKIGSIRAVTDVILVSKNIYSRRGIQWSVYTRKTSNHTSTQSGAILAYKSA